MGTVTHPFLLWHTIIGTICKPEAELATYWFIWAGKLFSDYKYDLVHISCSKNICCMNNYTQTLLSAKEAQIRHFFKIIF